MTKAPSRSEIVEQIRKAYEWRRVLADGAEGATRKGGQSGGWGTKLEIVDTEIERLKFELSLK